MIERLAILGVGLIGGSLALACRERGLARTIVGANRSAEAREATRRLGMVDATTADPAEAVREADLVVLAAPVGALPDLLRAAGPGLGPAAVITDVGSVKGALVAALEALTPPWRAFVGGHPIAGGERSGPEAARADLFVGARCILTPTPRTDPAALHRVEALWTAVGARVLRMDPAWHDELLAAVSHLPHVVAYALMAALLEEEAAGRELLRFGGGGLRDVTRIASSDPTMWRDICVANRAAILRALGRFRAALDLLEAAIAAADGPALSAVFARAKAGRDRLIAPGDGAGRPAGAPGEAR
jgi:cyclohexadieny/prephenate dehydrogenase